MANRIVDAEMRQHAEAAAEMVFAEYGHTLDFSEPTIGAVEAILNGFCKDGDVSEIAPTVALLFGAYIGELIRHCFPEARWGQSESAPGGLASPFIHLDDIQLFPITWCYKRLYNKQIDCNKCQYDGTNYDDIGYKQRHNYLYCTKCIPFGYR